MIYSLNAASPSAAKQSVSGALKFVALYARRLKRKHRGYGDTFYIDEVFPRINGKRYYLWRAVDQDGEMVDVYLQAKRDGAAERFFKGLLRRMAANPGGS
ncbi:MAG: putative transposase [Halioglobus sp.]|jgi:putative transposase